MVDMPLRRALLRVLEELWPGYQICWAYDGTLELAGYVGAELRPYRWDRKPTVRLNRDRNSLCHLVSVVDAAGQLRMWPLWWHLSKAWLGPQLLDVLPGRGVKTLRLNKIPEGGVHVDVRHQTVGAWQTADTVGIFEALPDLWSGWQTECWEDRFDEQVARCGDSLRVPELDLVAGAECALTWIRERVFQSFEDSPSGQVAKFAELLTSVGPGLVVSDDAVADRTALPRKDEWMRFVAACNGLGAADAETA